MTRAKRTLRFVATTTALWMVAGADWPASALLALLGEVGCC